jgi:hypothetical protein
MCLRSRKKGDSVYYGRFLRSRWHSRVLEQGTLKHIDLQFRPSMCADNAQGADRSKISLKKLAVREVMRHLTLSKLGSRHCLSAFEPV